MIIILEGPDLVGKTTLAGLLSEALECPVVHPWMDLSHAAASAMTLGKTLPALLSVSGVNVIFDRLHFSEYVYAQIHGRDHTYLPELFREWEVPQTYLIILTATEEIFEERFRKRGDDMQGLADILATKRLYSTLPLVLPSSIKVLEIDTSYLEPTTLVEQICAWLKESKVSYHV